MMVSWVIVLAGLALCIGGSAVLRVRNNQYRQEHVITSPLAEAMSQLVGIAGGIYLSLVMLTGFLGVETPERIRVLNLLMDPLAVVSIVLACVQPFGLLVVRRVTSGGGR